MDKPKISINSHYGNFRYIYIIANICIHIMKRLKASHQTWLVEKYHIEFVYVLCSRKLTQQHHITSQPNKSCSIVDHFQIRFGRKNNPWKARNENYYFSTIKF